MPEILSELFVQVRLIWFVDTATATRLFGADCALGVGVGVGLAVPVVVFPVLRCQSDTDGRVLRVRAMKAPACAPMQIRRKRDIQRYITNDSE